jgi:putative hydrolase of the HAD superfamily
MRNDIVPAARVGFQTVLFAGDRRSLRLRENDHSLDRSVVPDLIVNDLQHPLVIM